MIKPGATVFLLTFCIALYTNASGVKFSGRYNVYINDNRVGHLERIVGLCNSASLVLSINIPNLQHAVHTHEQEYSDQSDYLTLIELLLMLSRRHQSKQDQPDNEKHRLNLEYIISEGFLHKKKYPILEIGHNAGQLYPASRIILPCDCMGKSLFNPAAVFPHNYLGDVGSLITLNPSQEQMTGEKLSGLLQQQGIEGDSIYFLGHHHETLLNAVWSGDSSMSTYRNFPLSLRFSPNLGGIMYARFLSIYRILIDRDNLLIIMEPYNGNQQERIRCQMNQHGIITSIEWVEGTDKITLKAE